MCQRPVLCHSVDQLQQLRLLREQLKAAPLQRPGLQPGYLRCSRCQWWHNRELALLVVVAHPRSWPKSLQARRARTVPCLRTPAAISGTCARLHGYGDSSSSAKGRNSSQCWGHHQLAFGLAYTQAPRGTLLLQLAQASHVELCLALVMCSGFMCLW